MFKKYSPKRRIFLILTFTAYICCRLFVIVEACLPGNISGGQSNAIGGGIASIINGNASDQATLIPPEEVKIKNKDKTSLFVGESLSLETEILPKDCSFESLTYTTSDASILSIDEQGNAKALKKGSALLSVFSTSYPEKKDTLEVNVFNIQETSIESSIANASRDKDGVYRLDVNKSYSIKTIFTPEDTTDKTLAYSSDCQDNSIAVYSNGTIQAKSISSQVYTVDVTSQNGFKSSLKVKVQEGTSASVVKLTKISISKKAYTQSIGESVNTASSSSPYQITFEPSNATYKTYKLEISDSSVASISSSLVKGLRNGTATLKVTALKYPEIYDEREIVIDTVPLVSIGNIYLGYSSSPTRTVGESKNRSYKNASPDNASAVKGNAKDHIAYQSLNPDIASVDDNGKVTALKKGTATLIRKFYDTKELKEIDSPSVTKSLSVSVLDPQIEDIASFTLKSTLTESINDAEPVLYQNKSYDLKSGIQADAFYDKEGKENTSVKDRTLSYSIDSVYPEESLPFLSLNNGIFLSKAEKPTQVTFKVTHAASNLSDYLSFYLISDRKRNYNTVEESVRNSPGSEEFNGVSYPSFEESLLLSVSDTLTFSVNKDLTNGEFYRFSFESGKNKLYSLLSETNRSFSLKGLGEGTRKVLVTPCYQDYVFKGNSKVLRITLRHRNIEARSLKLYDRQGNELSLKNHVDEKGVVSRQFYKGEKASYKLIKSPSNYTIDNIQIGNSHPEVCLEKDGSLTRNSIGKTELSFKDAYSDSQVLLRIYVVNKCEFDSHPFTLSQTYLKYDEEKRAYHIQNGTPAKLKTNFTKDSTYKTVSYSSSDEKVLQIGNDGKITPLKTGEALITCLVDDQNTVFRSYSVKIIVDKKNLINNRKDFLLKLRKGLGHFGAFLITGICSTLFYLFVVRDKKWHFLFVPVNFVQGFLVAGLTELIQLFVPGRSGLFSDVRIDYIGFLFSAVTITLLFFLIPLIIKGIRKLIDKRKAKKE